MPTAIIAGLPAESDRRIQAALKQTSAFRDIWRVIRMRSNSRMPGLSLSQLEDAKRTASDSGGAHLLIFRGRDKREENLTVVELSPYFRLRWLDQALLKLIPHRMDDFFLAINDVLDEELEWIDTVKPCDVSCCLLLPTSAFSAEMSVRYVWTAATEPGIERIKLAARAIKQFETIHWRPNRSGPRGWIDTDSRVFDHRGALHGVAPFPRSWKFSYRIVDGFHYDVKSRDLRAFHVIGSDGTRHNALGSGHINIDPHGYVRV